jgi:hypothetical protein
MATQAAEYEASFAAPFNGYIYRGASGDQSAAASVDDQQCAVLVETLVPAIGVTDTTANIDSGNKTWTEQLDSSGASETIDPANGLYPDIPAGTPIATFDANGVYTGDAFSDGNLQHAAIFLGYSVNTATGKIDGMFILDQYPGKPAGVRFRPFDSKSYPYVHAYTVISTTAAATQS